MMAVLIYKDGFHIQTIIHTHNNNNTVAYWSRLASNVLCKKGVCLYCRLIVNSQARVIGTKFLFKEYIKGFKKFPFGQRDSNAPACKCRAVRLDCI